MISYKYFKKKIENIYKFYKNILESCSKKNAITVITPITFFN